MVFNESQEWNRWFYSKGLFGLSHPALNDDVVFAGAAGGLFIDFFETDDIDFTDNTSLDFEYVVEFQGVPRSYTTFTEMAFENAYSKAHILEDATEGLRLGYEVADAVNALDLSN